MLWVFGLLDQPGRIDEADVAEGLREVAELLAGGLVDLLGQQAGVVDVAHRVLEHGSGTANRPASARTRASQRVQSRNVPSLPATPSTPHTTQQQRERRL
ncbi:hypothetical protein [Arthrobacter sp. H20]|uniref:hypothetical protein n=1 Tax=Arthrobacter sp. H20 TaxID=1267981 RepID=UPI0012DCF198|nr:hypothetical protein [Arthrobacter sp. H20]